MKSKHLLLLGVAVCSLFPAINSAFAQGTAFTYQGRLTVGTNVANGIYDLRFRLFDDPSAGTQIGPSRTNAALAVSNGFFAVTLDFTNGAFPGADRWLDLGVRTNGNGAFTTLTPRQPLTPTPYAVMANTASNLLGALPVSQLSGTVGNSQLADNSVASAKIVDGTVANGDLANDAVNSAKILDGAIVGADLANNTVTSLQLADSVALGDAAVAGQLDIYKTSAGGPAISLAGIGTGGYEYLYQNDGQVGIYLDGDSGGGGLQYLYAADGSVGISLDGESGGAGLISIFNTNGSTRVSLDGAGTGAGGQITVYAQDGSSTVQVLGESNGAGLINVNNNVSANRVVIDGEGNGAGGQINLYAGDGGDGMILYGDDGDGAPAIRLYNAAGTNTVTIDGAAAGRGQIKTEDLVMAAGSIVTLASNATLSPAKGYVRVLGGGAVTLNATTAIANGSAIGSILILEGTSNISTVAVPDGANTSIGATRTLGLNDTLTLIWNGSDWVQLAFSDN